MLCYEVFKKWPLLSLFPGCIRKILSYFSLNNNFGTFNSCSGLFPFRHTTLSYYVRLCKIHHCPSESKFSPIKSSRFPDVYKTMLSFSRFAQKNNMICPRSQFCTCYDVIYITYLNRFRRKPAICKPDLSVTPTYLSLEDIATSTYSDILYIYSHIYIKLL